MNTDFWLFVVQPGLMIIDIPFHSSAIITLGGAWLFIAVVRFIVALIKMLPFV